MSNDSVDSVLAARGIGFLVGRTLTLQLLTVGVTIALVRILSPADYGLFAVAAAAQAVAQAASDMGLTAALIRQSHEPTAGQQFAVRGLLLTLGSAFSALSLTIAFLLLPAFGIQSEVAKVISAAMPAVPLYALRAVPMVLLERHLRFGRVAAVETAEVLSFNAFALLAALGGLGAYSLAGALPAAALAGTLTVHRLQSSQWGFSLDLGEVRAMVNFGLKFSLYRILGLSRELGFITLVTAIGGVSLSGFYTMSVRLFSFPVALASAVQRVSFPALSRAPDERPRRAARAAVLAAIVGALPLALVAGSSQALVSSLLGDRWLPCVDIVLIASAGMLLNASVSSAMTGLAFAEGRPGTPIVSVLASALAIGVATVVVVGPLASAGVGIAMLASSLVAAAVLAAGSNRIVRRALGPVGLHLGIAAIAAAIGYLLPVGDDLIALVAKLATTAGMWLVLEVLLARSELLEAVRLARAVLAPGNRSEEKEAQVR